MTLGRRAARAGSEKLRGKPLLTPDALPGLRIVGTYLHDRHQRGAFQTGLDARRMPTAPSRGRP